jgi:hypothetical protein
MFNPVHFRLAANGPDTTRRRNERIERIEHGGLPATGSASQPAGTVLDAGRAWPVRGRRQERWARRWEWDGFKTSCSWRGAQRRARTQFHFGARGANAIAADERSEH